MVLHLPLRAENLCNLEWSFIDFEQKLLTIPRKLMKVKDKNLPPFKMPLTDEVVAILKEQKSVSNHPKWVFISSNAQTPVRNESPNGALKRMGYNSETRGTKQRLHSFRGTFRSLVETLDTQGRFSFEAKERALDHHEHNQVVRAYAHSADYTEQLKPLMEFWSEFILGLKDGGTI